jgi:peptidoglycan/LPS O-acetylase OafA/YrhL
LTATVAADEAAADRSGPTFPALDTMRAVGSLAVVATHAAFWSGAYTQSAWGGFLARLDVGVAIFFVLSGFLLSRPHLDRRERGVAGPPVGRYLWKRVLRIFPVYVVAVAAAMLLLEGNSGASWQDWLRTLTLMDLYLRPSFPDGLTQMWSLATEVAFYAALPLLMLAALGRPRAAGISAPRIGVLLAGLVVLNVVWTLEIAGRVDVDGQVFQWLPSYLSWFAAGIAMATFDVLRVRRPQARWPRLVADLGSAAGTCWVGAIALLAVASTPIAGPTLLLPPTLGEAVTKNLLYAVIAVLLVLPAVQAKPGGHRLGRVLSLRPLRHLGHISYGVFCVHLVLLELIVEWRDIALFQGRGLELFALTVVSSVVVAEILYRAVELPFMRMRNLNPPGLRPSRRPHERSRSTSRASEKSTSS